MKVLQIPYTFYPDPVGGTEVYVGALAQCLREFLIDTVIAAPGSKDNCYDHRGLRVHRYGTGTLADLRDLYGEGDRTAAHAFGTIVAKERPDIVHFHAFTSGVSLAMVRAAKRLGVPVIFTYHTPTVTCQRGTMMRWGEELCDGVMEARACARCTLQALFSATEKTPAAGMAKKRSRVLAYFVDWLSPVLGFWVPQHRFKGRAWTALRMSELVELRHATTRTFLAEVDHVVAVSQWVKGTLIRNGVAEEKITVCRQGVAEGSHGSSVPIQEMPTPHLVPLKLAFLGRLDATKGVDILIQALRSIVGAPLQLHVFGVAQGESGLRYLEKIRHLAAVDGRVEFHSPVSRSEVITTLRNYDLLAVPSQWLETGPLVVLEAFAAGVPVIGSRLGGIAEIVRDGVDGILVKADDVKSWSNELLRLSADRSVIQALRRNIRPPRTMVTVAEEMAALYKRTLRYNNHQVPTAAASSL